MEGLRLNKSELKRQRDQLKLYQRVLPSLDLKRRQLAIENERCRTREGELRRALDELMGGIGAAIPMLANESIDLLGLADGLVQLTEAVRARFVDAGMLPETN